MPGLRTKNPPETASRYAARYESPSDLYLWRQTALPYARQTAVISGRNRTIPPNDFRRDESFRKSPLKMSGYLYGIRAHLNDGQMRALAACNWKNKKPTKADLNRVIGDYASNTIRSLIQKKLIYKCKNRSYKNKKEEFFCTTALGKRLLEFCEPKLNRTPAWSMLGALYMLYLLNRQRPDIFQRLFEMSTPCWPRDPNAPRV